jgi:hypothetical protein
MGIEMSQVQMTVCSGIEQQITDQELQLSQIRENHIQLAVRLTELTGLRGFLSRRKPSLSRPAPYSRSTNGLVLRARRQSANY